MSRETERRQGDLPAFPTVAARLVAVLERPDPDIDEIERLIGQDQVITAQIIRAANSAMFSGAVPIASVRQAIVRLGFRETADVAIAAASRSLFDVEDRLELEVFPDVWRALWHDSLVCAYGGRLLARELKLGEPDRVFLGGMFRDIGSLLVLKIVARGRVRGRMRWLPTENELANTMAELHPTLGANYLRSSCMPDYVVRIAADHHAPAPPLNGDTIDLHLVRLADALCQRIGVAPFAREELGAEGEEAVALLELSQPRVEYLELQFGELAEQVRELL